MGGISEKATRNAANFWLKAMNVKIIKVKNAETAEFAKLADFFLLLDKCLR